MVLQADCSFSGRFQLSFLPKKKKSCQAPNTDECTTVLEDNEHPWNCHDVSIMGWIFAWLQRTIVSLRSLRPAYRRQEICDLCVFDFFVESAVLYQLAKNCVPMTCTTLKVKAKKRKANSTSESEKRKLHGKGNNFIIFTT